MKAAVRDVMLSAMLITGMAATAAISTSAAAQDLVPVQYYQPEIQGYQQPAPRYYRPPQPRRVCWTQNQRVYVGRDNWGRPVYRVVPRRVCGYR
jgi:hypothetical protein